MFRISTLAHTSPAISGPSLHHHTLINIRLSSLGPPILLVSPAVSIQHPEHSLSHILSLLCSAPSAGSHFILSRCWSPSNGWHGPPGAACFTSSPAHCPSYCSLDRTWQRTSTPTLPSAWNPLPHISTSSLSCLFQVFPLKSVPLWDPLWSQNCGKLFPSPSTSLFFPLHFHPWTYHTFIVCVHLLECKFHEAMILVYFVSWCVRHL